MSEESESCVIKKLPVDVIKTICAGEVVCDIVSIVKELLENALDANSTLIKISFENNHLIIEDNGSGISKENLALICQPNCTSKYYKNIRNIKNNNFFTHSYGFRGEALHSISLVSNVEIFSRINEKEYKFTSSDKSLKESHILNTTGTKIKITEIFKNIVIRRNEYFNGEKMNARQLNKVLDVIQLYKLYHRDKIKIFCEKLQLAEKYERFEITENIYALYRYTSKFKFNLFVNDRLVVDKKIQQIVKNTVKDNVEIILVIKNVDADANIHPQKKEVKMDDKEEILFKIIEKIGSIGENTKQNIFVEKPEKKKETKIFPENIIRTKMYAEATQQTLEDSLKINTNENENKLNNKIKEIIPSQNHLNLTNSTYVGSCSSNHTYVQIDKSLYLLKDVHVSDAQEYNRLKPILVSEDYEVLGELNDIYNKFKR